MSTVAFVAGAVLVVAAELAVATARYDGTAVSEKAGRVEDRLDRELHDWVHRSLVLSDPGDASTARPRPASVTSG